MPPGRDRSATNCRGESDGEPRGNSRRGERHELPAEVRLLDARQLVAVQGTPEQRASMIAKRQRGRAARWQLLLAGLTDHMIKRMLASGYLIQRLPGVYAVGHVADIEFARETEALLCTAQRAALSARSAIGYWGMGPGPRRGEPVDIVIHAETRVNHPGVRSHRTNHLDRRDIRIHRGLPVTSPARSLVDIAPLVSDDELEHMLDEALERKLVRITEIRDTIARGGAGRPGVHRLVRLLDERDGRLHALSRHHAERELRRLLRQAGIAPDDTNARLHGYVPDMVWWEAKLIVEIDGFAHHGTRKSFEGDRRKDAILATHGWLTLRFTARRIEREPYAVIAEIAMMLGRRLATVAGRAA